jgi:hypothetical protein
MNFQKLTQEEKEQIIKIFSYGVSVGKNNPTITDTKAIEMLEKALLVRLTPDPFEEADSYLESSVG